VALLTLRPVGLAVPELAEHRRALSSGVIITSSSGSHFRNRSSCAAGSACRHRHPAAAVASWVNPRNRAKRRWRCLAYQACRARSFVRLARVASMVRVSPDLCTVTSPIDTITHHIERPRALNNQRIPLDPAVVPCRGQAQDGGSSMMAGEGTTCFASRIADQGS
jgi:hypothetical protein